MSHGKPGRPPFEVDEEVLQRIRMLARDGVWEKDIARCIGLHPSSFVALKQKYPALGEALKEGRAQGHEEDARALGILARNGDKIALIFRLKCQHKWSEDGMLQDSADGDGQKPVARRVLDSLRKPRSE